MSDYRPAVSPYAYRLAARTAFVGILLTSVIAISPGVRAQHAADQITIQYWQQWTDPVQKAAITKVIGAFEKIYPNIRVHEVDIAGDQKILTAISGGKPPDAASVWIIQNLGDWAARGAIMNLDPMIQASHMDEGTLTSGATGIAKFNSHFYGLPIQTDDFVLVVNTDLMKAAGITTIPKTMSEVAADAVKLTKKDASGRITQLGFYSTTATWMADGIFPAFGGHWYDAKTKKVTADDPGILRALQWEKNYVDKIGADAFYTFRNARVNNPIGEDFIDGHAAMTIGYEELCNLIPAYNKKVHFAVYPTPYADGHPEWANGTTVNGSLNVIPTGAPHPKEAFQFIKFMDSLQAQYILNTTWHSTPAVKSVSAQLDHGCQKTFIDAGNGPNVYPWPVIGVSNAYWTQFQAAEDKIMRGMTPLKATMTQLSQTIQAQLNSLGH